MARSSTDKVWRELRSIVKGLDSIRVHVGVIGAAGTATHAGSGMSNIDIATIHEFGAPRAGIPERSFIRSTFVTRRAELIQLQAAAARGLLAKRYSLEAAMGLIGTWAAGAVREQIAKYGPFLFAPLQARTIAAKGSSAPLIDTSQLVNSISFVVMHA